MAEDRKFKFEDGKFVNRVSGEPIPDDEPVIIFRARDRHALAVLDFYRSLAEDEHHRRAIVERIDEFVAFAKANPDRMKEPGITRHIRLNDEPDLTSTASAQSRIEMLETALRNLERANEELASQRSSRTYHSIVQDGAEALLIGLDNARKAARTALQEPGR